MKISRDKTITEKEEFEEMFSFAWFYNSIMLLINGNNNSILIPKMLKNNNESYSLYLKDLITGNEFNTDFDFFCYWC